MKKRWVTVTAAVLSTTLLLCGCAGADKKTQTTFTGEGKEEPVYQGNLNVIIPSAYNNVERLNLEPGTYISIIGKESSSAYWKKVKEGVEQAAEDLNAELGYKGSDRIKVAYNSPAKVEDIDAQVNLLDEELSRYPDAIGIASIDADACMVQFDLATTNGIPIVALDSGNKYQGIQCTVKTDNLDAARTGAYKLAAAIENEGQVILLVNDSKSETAKERSESFLNEMQTNHQDVSVVETIYFDKIDEIKKEIASEGNPEAAKMTDAEVLQYYLKKYPDLKGMFGTNEMTTKMGLQALQKGERVGEVVLMGFDPGEEQIRALEEGEITGLILQNPFGIGYASVVAAARTILQSGNEAVVDTGYVWVTKDNLKEKSIQNMLYK